MSRSFRRRPFAAYVGGSQQRDKRLCNRITRRTNRVRLAAAPDPEAALLVRPREALNAYSMAQDGTRGYRPFDPAGRLSYRAWWRWAKAK